MKPIFYLKGLLVLIAISILAACKKDNEAPLGSLTANDYIYNLVTRTFSPEDTVKARIQAPAGVKFVYCYLQRSAKADTLIYMVVPDEGNNTDFDLAIPPALFPANLQGMTGVKVMVKQEDNAYFEGVVKIDFYDPSKPFLQNFPSSLSPDIDGGTTEVTGNISSESGLEKVDIYDDYQTEGTYVLVESITGLNGAKTYALSYQYLYRKAAQHIKVVATDIFGQTMEVVIDMPVDMSNFKPKFAGFAESIIPDMSGGVTPVTGTITSVTGLDHIEIYDDRQGSYELVERITGLGSALNYELNYDYSYRRRAGHLRIVAVDADGLPAELIIPLQVTFSTDLFRDVSMMAQGTASQTSPSSIFIASTGTVLGNCAIPANEGIMDFLFYGTSTGPSFYAPSNTANVAANYRCDGVSWTIDNASALKATRFRVLIPADNDPVVRNIYSQYNNDEITDLSDSYFTSVGIGVPSSSSARYDPSVAPTANLYDITTAYLIWVRIPNTNGTYTNCLLRVKEVNVNSTAGLSTVKFDILVQK